MSRSPVSEDGPTADSGDELKEGGTVGAAGVSTGGMPVAAAVSMASLSASASFAYGPPMDEEAGMGRHSATERAFRMLARHDELRDLLTLGLPGAKDDAPKLDVEDPKLPDVVAIGDQSHGKSSLLERMFGISFPAGPMMKTRMFCEVRCRRLSAQEEPYATVGCTSEKIAERTVPLKEVPKEIEKITDRVAPGQKVSHAVITVTVFRHGLPPMMVVDTIGLIANPRRNQDPDLPGQIEEMARRRILNENCLIMVVLSIMQDPSNARSLRLANAIDPLHKRTMVVFTHADKCEEVSLAARLKGMYEEGGYNFPKSSIFVVRNRTDVETQEGLSLSELDERERRSLDRFRCIPAACRGCALATNYVSKRLCEAVCKVLPKTSMYLSSSLKRLDAQKRALDVSELRSSEERLNVFYQLFSKFTRLLQDSMGGEPGDFGDVQLSAKNLDLYEEYKGRVEKVHPLDEFKKQPMLDEIMEGWRETRGHEAIPGELHPKIAIRLLNRLLQDLHEPSTDLVRNVSKEVSGTMADIAQRVFGTFPALQERVIIAFNQYIFEREEQTQHQVERQVNMQCNPPYTLFSITGDMERLYKEEIGTKMLAMIDQPGNEQKLADQVEADEDGEAPFPNPRYMKSMMDTAQSIAGLEPPVRETDAAMRAKLAADKMAIMWKRWTENLIDSVPKCIDEYLMKQIRKNIDKFNGEFVVSVTNGADLKVLMRRDPKVEQKLNAINRNITLLRRAQHIVEQIPQMDD